MWQRSYPEIVMVGNLAWRERRFLDAGTSYWLAAFVAPTLAEETKMLAWCWQATERAQGRVSELEQPKGN